MKVRERKGGTPSEYGAWANRETNRMSMFKPVPSTWNRKTRQKAITSIMLKIIVTLLGVWLFLLFLLYTSPALQIMMVFQHTIRSSSEVGDPASYAGMRCSRRFETITADRLRLVGWHIMPRSHDSCKAYLLQRNQESGRLDALKKKAASGGVGNNSSSSSSSILGSIQQEDRRTDIQAAAPRVVMDDATEARMTVKQRAEMFAKALRHPSTSKSTDPEAEDHSKVFPLLSAYLA